MDMPLSLAHWTSLLEIDAGTRAALEALAPLIAAEGQDVIEAALARLRLPEAARKAELARAGADVPSLPAERQPIQQVREALRQRWLDYVLVGRFDAEYLEFARAAGSLHFRAGVAPVVFSAAYSQLTSGVTGLICRHLAPGSQAQVSLIGAINRVAFLDLGLASSVYYDAYLAEIADLADELRTSLARIGSYRDYEGGQHLIRVGRMSRALAIAAGQDPAWADVLQAASPLHDIGKIGVPDSVLLKPSLLSDAERRVMERHTEIGAEIIPDYPSPVIHMARRVALHHHERWDGSGYPHGLSRTGIPLEARIVAVCDVFDALLARRPYKHAWSRAAALDYIVRQSGTFFDPALVEVFVAIQPTIGWIQDAFADAADDEAPATLPDMFRAMRGEVHRELNLPRAILPAPRPLAVPAAAPASAPASARAEA